MMHLRRALPIAWAVISLLVIHSSAFAQGKSEDAKGRYFGIGQPKTFSELPHGNFKKNLEKLSPKARGKALGWLQRFEFPVEDVKNLRVNKHGDISYSDSFETGSNSSTSAETQTMSLATLDPAKIFKLHSRPESNNVVFLDFDGHTLEGTAWSSSTLVALPFDPSNNDNPKTEANFTQDELNTIHEIWHRVAEDFAAFDIDVTTEEPSVFTPTTGRVLFTNHVDASGQPMPSPTAGGIAYVGVFGRSDYVSRYSPALIYYTNLSNRSVGLLNYNAEVASHEFGHNLGLSHDGTTDGTTYYAGHGEGLVSWGPVMGYMLDKNVTQWSKGEYPNANNKEDDLLVISGALGFAGDDHGDSANQATPLSIDSNGEILVSNPENDPENILPENKGVIDDRNDVDWFYFDIVNSGTVEIVATPAWHAFNRNNSRGSNLDVELTLLDANLEIIDFSDPTDNTDASLSSALEPGRYYLQVDGVGNSAQSNYSDYASTGMYFIEGFISSSDVPAKTDTTPPSPSVMSWDSAPAATGASGISMVASQATDESGGIEYFFSCVAGDQYCGDSGWQTSQNFSATGLSADTYYEFKVKARDIYGNETAYSASMGDRTDAIPPTKENVPATAVADYFPQPATITKGRTADVTLDGSSSNDPDGTINRWVWLASDGSIVGETATVALKLREGAYTFTLVVTDDSGSETRAELSIEVSKAANDNNGKGKPSRK